MGSTEQHWLYKLWRSYGEPVMEDLISEEICFPEIRAYFKKLQCRVLRMYQKFPGLLLHNDSNNDSERIFRASADSREGVIIHVFLGTLEQTVAEIMQENSCQPLVVQEIVENTILIEYLHELGLLAIRRAQNQRCPKNHIADEACSWAITCKRVIVPLIESHNLTLLYTHHTYYQCWLASGSKEESPEWKQFIKAMDLQIIPSRNS